jgi:hypothetical protein
LRLLGSQGLFLLIALAVMVPSMIVAMALALPDAWASPVRPDDQAQVNRQLAQHPVVIAVVLVSMLILSAAGLVYWMANCVIVAERQSTLAAWGRGFTFCCKNVPAVLTVWLLNLLVGLVLAPLGMLGQLGVITEGWVLALLALLYAAATGYWGVVVAGLCMSLFLARRMPAGTAERTAVPAEIGG